MNKKIILADFYIDKNYYIDIFHFDDYLNKQLTGSSENQFFSVLTDFVEVLLCCSCNRPSVKRRHRRNFVESVIKVSNEKKKQISYG